jgi:large subunit ribosomal protein L29
MKADEIREWDDFEIGERLRELKEEQFKLRFRGATMELENPKLLNAVRRDIARLNTVLREREMEAGDDVPVAIARDTEES